MTEFISVDMAFMMPGTKARAPLLAADQAKASQFIKPIGSATLGDPLDPRWTMTLFSAAFHNLNEWLLQRLANDNSQEKTRLLDYSGGLTQLDMVFALQAACITIRERDAALATWLMAHAWEIRDHDSGTTAAIAFLTPRSEFALKNDLALGKDFVFVNVGGQYGFQSIPASDANINKARGAIYFSEANPCIYWSSHLRFSSVALPEDVMLEQARLITEKILPILNADESALYDVHNALNMLLDFALTVRRWSAVIEEWADVSPILKTLAAIVSIVEPVFASPARFCSPSRKGYSVAAASRVVDMIRQVLCQANRSKALF